ncbi:MAG: YidC/Oxa1 family membrane protein insertase [Bacilli bacterium]
MKSKILKTVLIMFMIVLLTGCTKTLKDENNKVIISDETGRSLTENILCRPTEEKILEKYMVIDANRYTKIPECEDFKITTGGYEGLWTSILVKPLAFLILKLGQFFNNTALGLILATLIIRIIAIPITKKTAMQSEKMKKAQPEIAQLEKKYKDKKDQASLMQKNQEMLAIYKKHHLNPLSGCIFALIQLPLFLAFLEAINRVPAIFEERFLGLKMGITPWNAINNGQYFYIIIIILIIGSTYLSFKLNGTNGGGEQQKQMQGMMKFMLIFISFISFSLPTAIAIYWITSSVFTIGQNLIIKRGKVE